MYWGNLFTWRFWFGPLPLALLAGVSIGLVWAAAQVPAFFVVWVLGALAVLATRVRCPHCLSRVRVGAAVCSHCGRDVA